MKILNLYCGIGGNRKLWPGFHEVTAVEIDKNIASIYADLFPNDRVIVADAHQYLLKHYKEYKNGLGWSSPPCQTHSGTNFFLEAQGVTRFPDLKLYEEIIFLTNFCKGKFVVENVKSYYEPLITPQVSGRHYFWSNFRIPYMIGKNQIGRMNGTKKTLNGITTHNLRKNNHRALNIDLNKYKHSDKEKLLNNCVDPELGLKILNAAQAIFEEENLEQLKLHI